MFDKRVRTVEEIIFETAAPPVILHKGIACCVETVHDNGVILYTEDGDRFSTL